MATAKLVPALVQLRAQVNAKYPRRDKRSDGWVGDTSHAARLSDHNPDVNGWVHAIDVDKDGISPYELVNVAIEDYRCNYVIFERKIWSRGFAFRARAYNGANAHEHHVHISVLHGAPAGDRRSWKLSGTGSVATPNIVLVSAPTKAPVTQSNSTLRVGMSGPAVLGWQRELWRVGIGVGAHDSYFGPSVEFGTRVAQIGAGLKDDGVVGPATRAAVSRTPNYPKPDGPGLPLCNYGGPGATIQPFKARLAARGWRIPVDGQFNPETKRILSAFQKEKRLGADGIGGAQTWVALWTR